MRLPLGYEVRMTPPTAWRRIRLLLWVVLALMVIAQIERAIVG
jgi:hypothetical protein